MKLSPRPDNPLFRTAYEWTQAEWDDYCKSWYTWDRHDRRIAQQLRIRARRAARR